MKPILIAICLILAVIVAPASAQCVGGVCGIARNVVARVHNRERKPLRRALGRLFHRSN